MDTYASQDLKEQPFQFTGDSFEYFKIWIVNVLLSIATLGIYSAWAKVRTNRYFYANTRVADATLEYLADPMAILRGRLIAVGVLFLWGVLQGLVPAVQPAFVVIFMTLLPWLVVKAMTFRARNTAYRNIRFDFSTGYGQAVKVYVGLALLSLVTFGLAYPYFAYRKSRFLVDNSAYGASPFGLQATAGSFYGIYLRALGLAVLLILMATGLTVLLGLSAHAAGRHPPPPDPAALLSGVIMLLVMMPFYLFMFTYIKTATANVIWSNITSSGHRFRSTLRTWPMFWIYLGNILAIIVSVGLLAPWAKVRLARYRMDNLALLVEGDLDGFLAAQRAQVSAAGEGITDVFDIDIGL